MMTMIIGYKSQHHVNHLIIGISGSDFLKDAQIIIKLYEYLGTMFDLLFKNKWIPVSLQVFAFVKEGKMKLKTVFILTCIFFAGITVCPAGENSPVSYHLSFDDMGFLDECYVALSGLKTPEERKLELVGGRFGKALFLGAVPLIMDENNMSGIDLDLVTAVIYNVAMAGRKGTGYDEPFIWGAGKLHPAFGGVAFWVRGPLRPGQLFNQSASSFGRLEKELIEIRLEDDGSICAYVEDARYVQHTVRTKPVWKQKHHFWIASG